MSIELLTTIAKVIKDAETYTSVYHLFNRDDDSEGGGPPSSIINSQKISNINITTKLKTSLKKHQQYQQQQQQHLYSLMLNILHQLMVHSRALNILFKGIFLVLGIILNDWIEYHKPSHSKNSIFCFNYSYYDPSRQQKQSFQYFGNNSLKLDQENNPTDTITPTNNSNNNNSNSNNSNNNSSNNSNNNNSNNNNNNNNNHNNHNNNQNNNQNNDDDEENEENEESEENEENEENDESDEFLNLESYGDDPFIFYDPPNSSSNIELQDPYTDYGGINELSPFETVVEQTPTGVVEINSEEEDEKRKREEFEDLGNISSYDLTLDPSLLEQPISKKIKINDSSFEDDNELQQKQENSIPTNTTTTTTTTISNVSPHFSQIRYTSPSFIDGDGSIILNEENGEHVQQQQQQQKDEEEEPPYKTTYPHRKEVVFERKPSQRLEERRKQQQLKEKQQQRQQHQQQYRANNNNEIDSDDSSSDSDDSDYESNNNLPLYIKNRAENIPLFMGPFDPATDGEEIPTLPIYEPILPQEQLDLFIERATEILESFVPLHSHIIVENIPISSILELLPQYNYDAELALESIDESTLLNMTLSLEDEIFKKWTPQDKDRFYKGFVYYGKKKFKDISDFIQTKNIQETIEYYYYWKQHDEYKTLKEQGFKPHFSLKPTITSSCFPSDPDSYTGKLKLNLVPQSFQVVEEVDNEEDDDSDSSFDSDPNNSSKENDKNNNNNSDDSDSDSNSKSDSDDYDDDSHSGDDQDYVD